MLINIKNQLKGYQVAAGHLGGNEQTSLRIGSCILK